MNRDDVPGTRQDGDRGEPLCILHIGAEKTGTTSIQESLFLNRGLLAARGIGWPGFLGERNHKLLAAAALAHDSPDAAMIGNAFHGDRAAHATFRKGAMADLSALATAHDAIIVSSEDLQRLPAAAVWRLGDLLAPHFSRFQVVMFAPRQDVLALRRRAQLIRSGHVPAGVLPALSTAEERRFYNYAEILNDWSAVFGEGSVRVVAVGPGSAEASADSVALFYRTLGVEADGFAATARLNRSPDSASLMILEALTLQHPRADRLRGVLERRLASIPHFELPPVGRDAVYAFLATFEGCNEELGRRWLEGVRPFDTAPDDYPTDDPEGAIRLEAERRLHILVGEDEMSSAVRPLIEHGLPRIEPPQLQGAVTALQ
ncbi:MAG: hypothetical protein AAGG47_22025 [Pseudomonadota bacterium]